ncbi:MAG: hypothetical protein R8G66_06770 [Cytophagales bacterium]|nr:hypothetical protein [Cytophagales bacterium]
MWTNAQEQKAYELMGEDLYQEAALAFERALFDSKDIQERNLFLILKSQCYKALGDYEAGVRNLKRIRFLNSDSLKQAVDYETVLLHYLNHEYQEAYSRIVRIKAKQTETIETMILSFLVNVDLQKWEEARDLLISQDSVFQFDQADIDYILPPKWKLKDPDKAYNLSLLPGIGQWYAGYFWKGVLSGSIQLVLGAFSIYSLVEGYFFSGTLTGVALFYTFYLGGARYASQLALRKNHERSEIIKERFFEKLEEGS